MELIVAIDSKNGIAKSDGKTMDMPWKNTAAGKEDMKWFKERTTSTSSASSTLVPVTSSISSTSLVPVTSSTSSSSKGDLGTLVPSVAVIMGRKTWESIPSKFRPLPGRMNIVISKCVPPHTTASTFFSSSFEMITKNVIYVSSFQAAIDWCLASFENSTSKSLVKNFTNFSPEKEQEEKKEENNSVLRGGTRRIIVIGGAEVYKQAIAHPLLTTAWVTKFSTDYACDLFFPLDLLEEKLPTQEVVRKTEHAHYVKYTK